MNKWKRRVFASFLVMAMVLSPLSGPGFHGAAAASGESAKTGANEVTTTAVMAENELGNIELEQTNVNATELTLRIAGNDAILADGKADSVKVTANMFYENTVTQNVTKTIPLESGKTEYAMDFENFGKFRVTVEYLKSGAVVSASEAVTVGIVAEQYNLALVSATFPAVLFSLSLWDGAENPTTNENYCITKDADGDPIPTITMFHRLAAWNWDELPENVYQLPTAPEGAYDTSFADWLGARNQMSAYVKDLYEMNPNSTFTLYSTDNYIEHMLVLFEANRIPESQYRTVFLSDGSGTYYIYNKMFAEDADGSLYEDMRRDWQTLKAKTREEGKFDASWAKYLGDTGSLYYQALEKYAAVAAEDSNVDWWVGRKNNFSSGNADVLQKVKDNATNKNIAQMLSAVQNINKDTAFKKLYRFNDDMFSEANKSGKPVMVILGTTVTTEQNFKDYANMVKKYYGDSYEYYYKGHPGTPTISYPSKQADLDELGITDIDSAIPAELILFFFPDIFMCGYSSSTFLSVESDEMACGIFNMTKEEGLNEKSFDGSMFDYFASRTSSEDPVYGALCKPEGQSYLLEFNDTKQFDIAIYHAADGAFTYYKNVAQSGYEWSNQVMRNAVVADIAPQDYNGQRIKPEVTVTLGGKELRKGIDYSVSYGSNVLPGQGSVTVKGRGDYAAFGSTKKYFVINKVENPLRVICKDTVYGEDIELEVINPSLGSLTYEYKSKDAEDKEYTASVPKEPGDYTIRVTSDGTACYKSAEAVADFTIRKALPSIHVVPAADRLVEGQSLSESQIRHGSADVAGTFSWKQPEIKPSISDSGKTKYLVLFTPEDTEHYEVLEIGIVVTVDPANSPTPAPGETTGPSAAPGESAGPSATPDETAAPSGSPNPSVPPTGTNQPSLSPSATPVPASLKQGQKITVGKHKYVAKAGAGKVTLKYAGPVNKKGKTVSVPAKVTYQGTTYPVTEIAAKALANNKYVKNVTIGASVTKIGTKAFYKCKQLKKVTIKGKKIAAIGKNAFKGISKTAKFKLPAAKAKAYKKKIKTAGFTLK